MAFATFRALGERVIGPRLGSRPFARALSRRVAAIHRLLLERPAAWVPAGDGDWDGLLLAAWRDGATRSRGDARRRTGRAGRGGR